MFLRRLFGMLAKMAKADRKVDAWETHAAEGAFARFACAKARRDFCVKVFNTAKNSRTPITRLAAEFAGKFAQYEDCVAVYELLWDIACAKGILKSVHKGVLRKLCVPLGLPPRYFDIVYRRRRNTFRELAEEETQNANRNRRNPGGGRDAKGGRKSPPPPPPPKTPLEEAYELLGCKDTDSNEALRRAYRNAAKRHHPDMLKARGCTERQIREASEMMSRINSAWELICEDRKLK